MQIVCVLQHGEGVLSFIRCARLCAHESEPATPRQNITAKMYRDWKSNFNNLSKSKNLKAKSSHKGPKFSLQNTDNQLVLQCVQDRRGQRVGVVTDLVVGKVKQLCRTFFRAKKTKVAQYHSMIRRWLNSKGFVYQAAT